MSPNQLTVFQRRCRRSRRHCSSGPTLRPDGCGNPTRHCSFTFSDQHRDSRVDGPAERDNQRAGQHREIVRQLSRSQRASVGDSDGFRQCPE